MKKQFILAAMAVVALFTACSNEEENMMVPAEGAEVNFVIGGPVTRTSTTEDAAGKYITNFVATDQIGIYATGGATGTNALYKVASDGTTLESTQEISYTSTDKTTFYAYSPYQENQTGSTVSFSVKSNQSAEADFNASNFMTTVIANKTSADPNIELTFKPRLTLVRLEMAGELGKTASAVSVNGKPTLTWTYAANTSSDENADIATSGNAINIPMYHQNSDKTLDNPVFAAFLPEQKTTTGVPFFTITIGSSTYTYTPSAAIDLKANTIKKFKISIAADGTTRVLATTTNEVTWTEDGTIVENNNAEVSKQMIELISADAGDFSKATLNASVTGLQGTTEGWNPVIVNSYATIEINSSENAATITGTGTGAWYQRALTYRTADNAGTLGKYTLSFSIKSNNSTDITVAVMRGQTTNIYTTNAYFMVGAATAGKAESTTSSYVTKSLTVDFSKIKEASGNERAATVEDLATGIMVLFYAKDAKGGTDTHYIKDVTLEEAAE